MVDGATLERLCGLLVHRGFESPPLRQCQWSQRAKKIDMGVFEFLMLFCFGFSWPFSILKSLRSRSTQGKSLIFMLMVELGYVFGMIHKLLYSRDWVIWAYIVLFFVVLVDIALYIRNWRIEHAVGKVVHAS